MTSTNDQHAPMSLLILGGSGFLGGHYLSEALRRGHEVSVFHRGLMQSELPAGVESILGDREGDLSSLRGRSWDAVIDLATLDPAWVTSLGETIGGAVQHYTFISTISAYDRPGRNAVTTEAAEVLFEPTASSAFIEDDRAIQYGARKAHAEYEAERWFPGATLVLRPGFITGPGDETDFLAYWVERVDRGGEILSPVDPSSPVQFIDARDLARWNLDLIERGVTGTFNALGPEEPLTFESLLNTIVDGSTREPRITTVASDWLYADDQARTTWAKLGFFATQGDQAIMRMSNERARAAGIRLRPLAETVSDLRAWLGTLPRQRRAAVAPVIGPGPTSATDDAWSGLLWKELQVLLSWHLGRLDRAAGAMVNEETRDKIVPSTGFSFSEPDYYGGMLVCAAGVWQAAQGGGNSLFIKMKQGSCLPHHHTFDYHLIVVQGELTHWTEGIPDSETVVLGPGSYWYQPAGVVHQDTCVSADALMYCVNLAAGETTLV